MLFHSTWVQPYNPVWICCLTNKWKIFSRTCAALFLAVFVPVLLVQNRTKESWPPRLLQASSKTKDYKGMMKRKNASKNIWAHCADCVCYKFLFVMIATKALYKSSSHFFSRISHKKTKVRARACGRGKKAKAFFDPRTQNGKRGLFSFNMRCCYQICVTLGNKLVLSFCFDFFFLFPKV